jgi:hypothetical protein
MTYSRLSTGIALHSLFHFAIRAGRAVVLVQTDYGAEPDRQLLPILTVIALMIPRSVGLKPIRSGQCKTMPGGSRAKVRKLMCDGAPPE